MYLGVLVLTILQSDFLRVFFGLSMAADWFDKPFSLISIAAAALLFIL